MGVGCIARGTVRGEDGNDLIALSRLHVRHLPRHDRRRRRRAVRIRSIPRRQVGSGDTPNPRAASGRAVPRMRPRGRSTRAVGSMRGRSGGQARLHQLQFECRRLLCEESVRDN